MIKMNKQEFLAKLQTNLSGLPEKEVQDSLGFYSEMIDDRMEEGLSEEDAVRDIGSAEEIARQIIAETPLITIVKDKIKPKRKIQAWEIVLLILGAPIWLSLLIAAFAVILSLYISFWALIISFWSVFASLIAVALCGIGVGIGLIWNSNILTAIMLIATGLICAGLSIFCFYGCKVATKGVILLAKKIVIGTKNVFMKKEKTA
jgi:uncharacterized membrane protein